MNTKSIAILSLIFLVCQASESFAQNWPVTVPMENGQLVKMYAPQASAYGNDQMVFQSAVSVNKEGDSDPVFGMVWAKAQTLQASNSDRIDIQSLAITDIRFPASLNSASTKAIESLLEVNIPKLAPPLSKKSIDKVLKLGDEKQSLDASFSNKAPKVFYRDRPTMLVLIDGNPVWQKNENWGVDAIVNSPNTIVRDDNGLFYVYGSKQWYVSRAVGGPYSLASNTPENFRQIETALATADKADQSFDTDFSEHDGNAVEEIIISTEPAELIQSNGAASFSPISNTNLMYVDNSPNDIFMDVNSQQYFILLSGRWFAAKNLNSTWTNIQADQLPEDFARIPAGSAKDNVLASVAGTPAAKNALLDAQVPQTARVDRKSASASVNYDGDPEFENISGTRLAYAKNTASPVIRYNRQYFLVDNGIWFQSNSAGGPWVASNYRPEDIDLIPPSYPVYNVKYVYIYDYTPDYIYTGYTPGYLNTYIYGPTIVYGTGYYYRPWHRHYYFPRPYTWGFNMHYTPWTGWSFGFNFYGGWFNGGYYGYNGWNNWGGGWWGPTRYRPSYCGPSYRNHGYYGYRGNQFRVNDRGRYYSSNNYSNNVYRERRDVVTRDDRRYYGNRTDRDRMDYTRPGAISGDRNNSPRNTTPRNTPQRNEPGRDYRQQPQRNYNPERNSPERTNPERSNPERTNPGRNNPERNSPERNTPQRNNPERNVPQRNNAEGRPQNRVEQNQSEQRREPQRMERNERPNINRQAPPARRDNETRRPERRVGG